MFRPCPTFTLFRIVQEFVYLLPCFSLDLLGGLVVLLTLEKFTQGQPDYRSKAHVGLVRVLHEQAGQGVGERDRDSHTVQYTPPFTAPSCGLRYPRLAVEELTKNGKVEALTL